MTELEHACRAVHEARYDDKFDVEHIIPWVRQAALAVMSVQKESTIENQRAAATFLDEIATRAVTGRI